MFLEPGDTVNIPPTDVFFVAGEVNQPGSFPLKDGTTLRQAISLRPDHVGANQMLATLYLPNDYFRTGYLDMGMDELKECLNLVTAAGPAPQYHRDATSGALREPMDTSGGGDREEQD